MSPREEVQDKITQWLEDRSSTFSAPYGILPGLEAIGRGGKVRTITFGIARLLDATVKIWSVDKISLVGRGPASRDLRQSFTSADDVISHLAERFHSR